MSSSVGLAAGCRLVAATARFEVEGDALTEELRLEVRAGDGCSWVRLDLPSGTVLGEHRGHERRGDGVKVRLDEPRWVVGPRSLDGRGEVVVLLPDLLGGDRVFLEVTRVHALLDLDWSLPVADRAVLTVEGATLSTGGSELERRGAATEVQVVVGRPRTASLRLPAGDVVVDERLTLRVPTDRDPQLSLYPGGGSSVSIEHYLAVPASSEERWWPLDAPADSEVRWRAEPAGSAELVSDVTGHSLRFPASDGPSRVTVSWVQADAPTFGERPAGIASQKVSVEGGDLRVEGAVWTLQSVHGRPVIPDRAALIRALDRRFRYAAMPEPGAPMELRGADPSWELAASLRPTLTERAPVAPLVLDPWFPRPLVRARRSGVLSPLEAALTAWLYARQSRLEADWVLVRPASLGPGGAHGPAGFERPLVRIVIDGVERFVDPACTVCGPFELPPELEGAAALSPATTTTQPPTPGRLVVRREAEQHTWSAAGPPALLLRAMLVGLPPEERARALATSLGGPGATLISVDGLDDAGAPVAVVVRPGTGMVPDPTALPAAGPDGDLWFEWIGERVVEEIGVGARVSPLNGAKLERTVAPDRVVLTVRDRQVSPSELTPALSPVEPPSPTPPSPGQR